MPIKSLVHMLINRKILGVCGLALLSGTLLIVFRSSKPQLTEPPAVRSDASSPRLRTLRQPANSALSFAGASNLHQMNARDVLAFAKQLATAGQFAGADRALAPHLARNWRATLAFTELHDALADSTGASEFRAFLIDFLIHAANLTPEESARLDATLIAISESSITDPALRRYALMALRNKADDVQTQRIRAIAQHQDTPAEVRAAAISAMRRTGDVLGHDAFAREVLSQAQVSSGIVVQHAMVSLAKGSNAAGHAKAFAGVASTTANPEVHASAIYALGMAKTPEAVMTITKTAARHPNPHIARYSLQRNEPTILQMLDANQPRPVVESAIEASRLAEIVSAVPLLRLLAEAHTDPDVRIKATQAIADLSTVVVNTNAIRKRNEN